jgi:hypothetical protein
VGVFLLGFCPMLRWRKWKIVLSQWCNVPTDPLDVFFAISHASLAVIFIYCRYKSFVATQITLETFRHSLRSWNWPQSSLYLKNSIFWDITPCSPMSFSRLHSVIYQQDRTLHSHRCENVRSNILVSDYCNVNVQTLFWLADRSLKNVGCFFLHNHVINRTFRLVNLKHVLLSTGRQEDKSVDKRPAGKLIFAELDKTFHAFSIEHWLIRPHHRLLSWATRM